MSIWAWTCLASATSASASREITAWGASKCSNDFVGTVQRLAHAIIHIYVDIVSQSSSKIDPLSADGITQEGLVTVVEVPIRVNLDRIVTCGRIGELKAQHCPLTLLA